MVRKTPLANQSGYLYKIQLGYVEKPVSRIEVALALVVWYITAYVVLSFPLSYYRHGFIIYSVAILFVVIQWRYFFSLLIYLSLFVPLFPIIGTFYFSIPLLVIPVLGNIENYIVRVRRILKEREKASDNFDEVFFTSYLAEN